MVECSDQVTQTKVLNLGGYTIDNKVVRCSKVDPTLSGDDIAQFILTKLQTLKRVQTMRQTWDDPPRNVSVSAVEASGRGGRTKGVRATALTLRPHNLPGLLQGHPTLHSPTSRRGSQATTTPSHRTIPRAECTAASATVQTGTPIMMVHSVQNGTR